MFTWRAAMILLVIALAVAVVLPSLRAYVNQQEVLGELRAEAEHARDEVDDLTAEVARWEDSAYIVAQARERLTLVFPGETPYRVVDAETVDGPVAGSPAADREPEAMAGAPWYTQLWGSVVAAGESDTTPSHGSEKDQPGGSSAEADNATTEPATNVDSGE